MLRTTQVGSTGGEALFVGASVDWLFHPGGVEIGPVLRLDHAGPVTAVTINFATGFAGGG